MQDAAYGQPKLCTGLVDGELSALHAWVQHDGYHGVALEANLVNGQKCCLQARYHRVQTESIAVYLPLLDGSHQMLPDTGLVALLKRCSDLLFQL